METPEEHRWKLLQEFLLSENRGDEPRSYSSGRTLFGIKSHVEEVIERVAEEDEQRCREQAEERRTATGETDGVGDGFVAVAEADDDEAFIEGGDVLPEGAE